MNDNKRVDISILIPIGIGAFSVMGICLALLIGYLNRPQTDIPVEQTAAPFKYHFLGTETFTPDPELETATPEDVFTEKPTASATPVVLITATQEKFPSSPAIPTQTSIFTGNATPIPTHTSISTSLPTDEETFTLEAGKYDDTNSYLEYDGDWVSELFVEGVYQETLYISTEIANSVTFTFTGKQVIIGYLGDIDFGTIAITIDDDEFTRDQSSGSEWISPQLTQGNHSVVIIHESGDFVNLDYIQILN
jgi:hypothetical protein